jgi:hypothetical protein
MKCFEVTLNRGAPTIVGAPGTELLRGSLFLAAKGNGGAVFSAHVEVSPSESKSVNWVSTRLHVGDELLVRVIESSTPDPWKSELLHGEGAEPSSPELACSFCRRKQGEVERLIASGSACICGECVALCVESLAAGPVLPP